DNARGCQTHSSIIRPTSSASRRMSCFVASRPAAYRMRHRWRAGHDIPHVLPVEPARETPMNIRDVMTPNPRTLTPEDNIRNAARIMRDEDTGVVPIVDNGRPVGMVTDRDIVVRAVADGGQLDRPLREILTAGDLHAVSP